MNETEIKLQEAYSNIKKLKKRAMILGILSSIALGAIGISIGAAFNNNRKKELSELDEFLSIYEYLKDNFYLEVDNRKLIDGMYYGLTEAFGEQYTYYTSKANGEIQNYSTEGVGLGVSRIAYYGNCLIEKVMPDSPASKGGLKSGDIIYACQEEGSDEIVTLNKISPSLWSKYIAGEQGTKVKIYYLRNNEKKETLITRGIFQEETVTLNSVTNIDGYCEVYMSISTFLGDDFNTGELLYGYLSRVQEKYGDIDHLIIDLRGNGGGYVDYCLDALGVFLPKGSVGFVYNYKNSKKKAKTTRENQIKVLNNNIDLLIDDKSASASETFVMGLMDSSLEGIETYGCTSYGKGVCQSFKNVFNDTSDKNGTIRYTFASTETEKGNSINRIGIEPTVFCGYVPSNEKIYRHYVKGVTKNESLSNEDKDLVREKINAVLETKYISFDEALKAYQENYETVEDTKIFDEKTAKHLQEKMYLMFENSSSVEYNVEKSLYSGYVQGKENNDLFSSIQRLIVKRQINEYLHTDYSYFDDCVKAFQEKENLEGKNGLFDKETADLLQGRMYDLGVIKSNEVLEACGYGK